MKIAIIFGTRPEAIKLAPLVKVLKTCPGIICRICVTAQHREMLDQVLNLFEIKPDVDLDIMLPHQDLANLTSRIMEAVTGYLEVDKPEMVVVQGDTTTTFVSALAAFYQHIPVAHVEAGLRTGNLAAPWPEEANRILTTRLSQLHFAPTEINRDNLIKEGIDPYFVFVTGNTVIDALLLTVKKMGETRPEIPGISVSTIESWEDKPLVLITGHRRESFGKGFQSICQAISELSYRYPDVQFIYPVHLNPNVRTPVLRILGNSQGIKKTRQNIHLIEPTEYLPFIWLMKKATLILTDSGGIQEEAPALGKPVLVMREVTERPEAVAIGTAKLVGANYESIVEETSRLLDDKAEREKISKIRNPYGDGHAAEKIRDIILTYFSKRTI